MILITGGLGFIGSNIINKINSKFLIVENSNIVNERIQYIKDKRKIIDIVSWKNLRLDKLDKYNFKTCIHFGAISSTLENNLKIIRESNISFSKKIFLYCEKRKIDFIYASSASVYGNGKLGYYDLNNKIIQKKYKPLNPYGKSKFNFDKFIIKKIRKTNLKKVVGLRFFNVYGINEFHKLGQCSPIYKFFYEIKKHNKATLFSDFKNSELIERDFIYIDDVVEIIKNLLKKNKIRTIVNVGTAKPITFSEIARLVSLKLNKNEIILKDLPSKIRLNYQYQTKSNNKLIKSLKLIKSYTPIKIGVDKYLQELKKSFKY